MRQLTRRSLGALLLSALAAQEIPPSFASSGSPRVPSRGFNLPGWVDREAGTAPARAVLEKLHHLGFETIRLPVAADPLLSAGAGSRRNMLGEIAGALAELLALGFAVIVDLHPDGDFAAALRVDPQEGARRAEAAWNLLGDVLTDFSPDLVYAELLNEPPMEQPAWLELRERLAATVRTRCPRHPIVWGPARYQGVWEIDDVPPLADGNTIAAIHYYFPLAFTHQCENWDDSALGRMANLPFPATRDMPAVEDLAAKFRNAKDGLALSFLEDAFKAPWTVAQIATDFAKLRQWSNQHRCPVMVNEFGVLNFCVDASSRALWIRATREAAEANGVGWTYWEFDRGFGFVRDRRSTEGFDLPIIDALTMS